MGLQLASNDSSMASAWELWQQQQPREGAGDEDNEGSAPQVGSVQDEEDLFDMLDEASEHQADEHQAGQHAQGHAAAVDADSPTQAQGTPPGQIRAPDGGATSSEPPPLHGDFFSRGSVPGCMAEGRDSSGSYGQAGLSTVLASHDCADQDVHAAADVKDSSVHGDVGAICGCVRVCACF